jgi:hypothetical protein
MFKRLLLGLSIFSGLVSAQTQTSTLDNGAVGPVVRQDGSVGPLRTGRSGEVVNTEAHGRYQEAVIRGQVYSSASQSAVTIGAGLSTTSVWTLYNPFSSKVNCVLLQVGVTPTAAPAGAAVIFLTGPGSSGLAAPTSVTKNATAWPNNLIGSAYQSSACQVYTAATLGAAPIVLRTLGAFTATTAPAAYVQPIVQDIAGLVVITPGNHVTIQGLTTAVTAFIDMTWEEVPF